ncbi:response regulator [Leptobacterium flavescens]|uniref:Response regulator n=1 Tax=Leptobacterium flavescens TaxID=472055 RepID=A0A6P0UPF5_9FLAO|nr:response regulator transcription factor [Leptobacterium flavescens]NER13719.1 response regulator [Leptobacterium flavescens]
MTAPIQVLIIEDKQEEAIKIEGHLKEMKYETVIADNLKDAYGFFFARKPDLVIIDIFLNGEPDGILFAQKITENESAKKPFIFLTSSMDRTIFELAKLTDPYSYLLKPYNILELEYAIELALEKFAGEVGVFSSGENASLFIEESFFIKKNNTLIKVLATDIEYIEVEGKYSKIYTTEANFLVQQSLVQLLQKLPENHFLRVHRNYLVNVQKIKKLNLLDNQIILNNGKAILISRRYKESFIETFNILK